MKNFTNRKYLNGVSQLLTAFLLFVGMIGISHDAHSQCAVSTGPVNDCSVGDAIDSFTFNGVSANNTGCSSGNGYTDFGSTPGFTAYPGKSINISAVLGGGNYQQGLAIWIDYNNDGIFDPSEYVFSSLPALTVSGSLTIPSTAVSAKVKMRVMCSYFTTPMASEACVSNLGFYGETEDYDLTIMPLVPNNAAVWAVDSPMVFCAGSQDIYATIGNSGTNRIDSVNIYWEFNGVMEPMIFYNQQLDTINGSNPSSAMVFLGSKNFAFGASNSIRVWTSMPNGVMDTVNVDDTLSTLRQAALTGNYTIDASLPAGSGNYTSFSSLSDDLNNFGVCGPVTVTVDSGAYYDYLYLNNVQGVSSTNSITIDGIDSAKVSLIHDGSVKWATVSLINTSYVTITNMHIQNAHPYDGAAFSSEGGSSYFELSNSYLEVDKFAGSWTLNNIQITGTVNHSRIEKNRLSGGSGGIRMGDWSSGYSVGNEIRDNDIFNINEIGLEAYNQDSLIVSNNRIEVYDLANTWSTGAVLISCNNFQFHANYVKARNLAMNIDNFSSAGVMNRERSIINNMLIADEFGVQMYNVDSVHFHHNSVSTIANTAWQIYDFGAGIGNYDVRNNIFSSEYGRSIYTESASSIFDQMDYNLYYLKKGGIMFSLSFVDYADLSSFQSAASTLNLFSLEGDPQFLSPINDLHVVGVLASEAGDVTLGVLRDIDGETRPLSAASSVDIGADEYDLPSCPPPYQLEAFNPTLDSISLQWVGGAGDYQVEIVAKGDAQGTGDTINTSTQSIRIGNLNPASGYEFYVRKVCNRGDSSMWWGPMEFYTAYEVAYLEDFESFDIAKLTNGWATSTFSDPQWVSSDYSNYGSITKDHTIGAGGIFTYMQTWNSWQPGTSDLLSPYIYVDTNQKNIEFSFWYFMNGADMGDLSVYVDTNGVSNWVTTISGRQQHSDSDPWMEFSTFLSGYEGKIVQLRFQGNKGPGGDSEIGLDDIMIDTVPAFNVGVINLVSPDEEICAGQILPIVGVRNLGSTSIDSVKVLWEINGVIMDSVMYSTTILSGDTAEVTLGTITLNSTGIYDIKIYTKDPNSSADPYPADDTLKIENLRTGLSGTYSIDPSSPASMSNFIDFKSVSDVLALSGVCGPTTINVASGVYYESIKLSNINGISSVNTLLFEGVDSSNTVISHDGSVNFATWTFEGTDYVTLKNLGIECTNYEGGTILFAKGSDHNTITNCNLLVDTFSNNWALQNILISSSTSFNNWGGYSSYNTIENNRINGGYYAVNFEGSDIIKNVGNRVLNNAIDNAYYYGVYGYYQDSMEIVGNNINMWGNSDTYSNGVQLGGANNSIISNNYIYGKYYGITYYNWAMVSPSHRRKQINNNMIVMESSDMWGGTALTLQEVDSVDIQHNSIHVNSESSSAAIVAYAWSVTLSDIDMRNNIISSKTSPTIDIGASITSFSFMDNNNYYTEGGTLAMIDGINYSTLSDLQSLNPTLNINSLEGNPQFASSSDLHIIGNFVDNKGDNTLGIAVDIDGDTRPFSGSTSVDIGADEFDPPSCPPVLNMTATNALANSIDLQWDGGSGDFEYEIVLKDSAQGSGISAITILDSLTVGGLDPSTEYDYYVREICARGDTSIWWGPISFKTITPFFDMMISSISAPVLQSDSCYSSNESVSLIIVNNGNVEMDFEKDTTDVFVNISGAAVQNLSFQLNDNSLNAGLLLAAGDSLLVNMGSLNMTTSGTYNLEAFLSMGIDERASNDTLRKNVVNATSGGSLSSNMIVCGSGNVILSTSGSVGDIQWQRLVAGVYIDEAGADSTSYEVFVDSIVSFRAVACGMAYSDTIVITPQPVPAVPTVINDTAIVFCGDSGTAVLTASTSISGNINWYEDTTASFVLSTGSSFNYGLNTSPQSVTTSYSDTFYVSVLDVVTTCESELAMAIGTVICTVGEKEIPSAFSGISIQPNPSKGVFHIIALNIKEEMSIEVYNTNGKLIYGEEDKLIGNFDRRIDLSEFSKGLYFVKIQSEGSLQMKKIVIQ